MRRIWQLISALTLAGTIVPAAAFLTGHMSLDAVKVVMLVAAVAWFLITPLWMDRETAA